MEIPSASFGQCDLQKVGKQGASPLDLNFELLTKVKMDSMTIKLNATHSHLQIRLAEIRFDLRQNVRSVKVTSSDAELC